MTTPSSSEASRATAVPEPMATATSAQSGDRDTLISYLGGSANVPLLQPATSYQLRIRYDAVSRAADGTESTEADQTQDYYFKTANQAPKRIDPWVLATTPNDEERFVFYQDPLKVVFNDTAIVQLYRLYRRERPLIADVWLSKAKK